MERYTTLDWVSWGLTTVGALNWGLIGLAGFNLVSTVFGRGTLLERLVYSLVGLASGWSITRFIQYATAPRPMARIEMGR